MKIYISEKRLFLKLPWERKRITIGKGDRRDAKHYKDGFLLFDNNRYMSKEARQNNFFPPDNLKEELLKVDPSLEISYV
jgi:hypothetical protein